MILSRKISKWARRLLPGPPAGKNSWYPPSGKVFPEDQKGGTPAIKILIRKYKK